MENLTAYNELNNWIEKNPNWDTGIALLIQYGKKQLVVTVLNKGQFPANKKLMLSTIRSLRDEFKPKDITISKNLSTSQGDDPDLSIGGSEDQSPVTMSEVEGQSISTNLHQSPSVTLSEVEGQPAKPAKNHPVFSLKAMYPNLNLDAAPDQIKIMFADAIASWNRLCEAHDTELEAAETDEQRAAVMAVIVAADEENRAAHAELKHWNDTQTILGKHPKMMANAEEKELKELLDKEGVLALNKKRDAAYNNFARYRKWCDENPGHEKFAAKETLRNKWENTLNTCDKLLNTQQ